MSRLSAPEASELLADEVEVESTPPDEVELPPLELLDSPGKVGELGLLEFENPEVCAPPPPQASGAESRRSATPRSTTHSLADPTPPVTPSGRRRRE